MKTPKRYQDKPTPLMPEDSEPDWYVLHEWCQRAKRKNKYSQYKHTITKLKAENKRLKEQKAVISATLKCLMRTLKT